MIGLTRRQLMAGTALAAVGVVAKPAVEAFAQQPRPVNTVNLTCTYMQRTVDGKKCQVRSYQGATPPNNFEVPGYTGDIPGPIMILRPGEQLLVNLTNKFAPYDSTGWDGQHNVPHDLSTTNLHLHGMDVIPHLFEPVGTSDPKAPMIAIKPGQTYKYVFDIPRDHEPGFNWYHPHHHGSTVVQAASGMAGGIVVLGDIDEVPEIKAARDILLVMQDLGLYPSDNDPNVWAYLPKQNAIWQTFGGDVTIYDPKTKTADPTKLPGGFTTGDYKLRYFLLNGQPFFKEEHNPSIPPSGQPTPNATQLSVQSINLKPGEVVRIRMLNGNSDNYMPIVVDKHEVHLLALDGVNFPTVRTIPVKPIDDNPDNEGQLQLAPANRAEFMIKASLTPGTYPIVQLAQKQQFLYSAQKVIANLVVTDDEPVNMSLPYNLPAPARDYPLIKPEDIKRVRQFVFSATFPGVKNPYVGIDFLLSGTQYHEDHVTTYVQLDTAEQWILVVPDKAGGGTEGHPFHIHVNSFEVISVDGKPVEPGTIKDTIWIKQNSRVVIRQKFQEWVGKSVFHCHILPHEDTGMMHNFIIQKGAPPIRSGEIPADWPICTTQPG